MKKVLFLIVLGSLIATPVAAQKVYIDYDKSVNFDKFKSFAWLPTPETSVRDSSPLMDSRIKFLIEHQLAKTGLYEDTENPDCYVTYHTDEQQEMRLNTTNFGYDYGPGWGWDPYWGGGMSSSTTTAHRYTTGTLIIDIWDAETKKAVWRGTASSVVPSNPDKEARKIEKALKKMMRKWEKMYKSGR